jgi:hypothetical protein
MPSADLPRYGRSNGRAERPEISRRCTVKAHYYPNHGHGILFDTPLHGGAVARVVAFLGAQLSR